jgi:hypothetical protein
MEKAVRTAIVIVLIKIFIVIIFHSILKMDLYAALNEAWL